MILRNLNCSEAQDLITLQVDHRLSDEDCFALQHHLQICSHCDKEYRSEKVIKELLSKHCKTVKIPEKLHNRISDLLTNPEKMAALSSGFSENPLRSPGSESVFDRKRNLIALSSALVLIFFLAAYFLVR